MERGVSNKEKKQSAIYLTVSNGLFSKRVKDKTAESKERVLEQGPNKGTTIHEEFLTDVIGKIVDINIEESDNYGDSWAIKMDCSTEEEELAVTVKLPYSSSYSTSILNRLMNMDLSQDVNLRGYCFPDKAKGKDVRGISVFQAASTKAKGEPKTEGGVKLVKVESFFTKEKPNGCPEMEKIVVKGKETWDDTKRMKFLEEVVLKRIKPQFETKSELRVKFSAASEAAAEKAAEKSDDLPF